MGNKQFNYVQKLNLGDKTAKAILSYIAGRDGKDGCTASRATISRETEIPDRTVNRKIAWLKSCGIITIQRRYRKTAIMRVVLPDVTDLPSGGKSPNRVDLPPDGKSMAAVDLPLDTTEPATIVAEELIEHAGRAARARQPTQWPAPRAQRSGVGFLEAEGTASDADTTISLTGRSASLASLKSRSADLPSAVEADASMPAIAAETEVPGSPIIVPRGNRPVITAEQSLFNAADARLQGDLLKCGIERHSKAIDWLGVEDRHQQAVAAEMAERGAGLAFVRRGMLKSPG